MFNSDTEEKTREEKRIHTIISMMVRMVPILVDLESSAAVKFCL